MAEIPQYMLNKLTQTTTMTEQAFTSYSPLINSKKNAHLLIIILSCLGGFFLLFLIGLLVFFIKFKPHRRLRNRCNNYRAGIYNGKINIYLFFFFFTFLNINLFKTV